MDNRVVSSICGHTYINRSLHYLVNFEGLPMDSCWKSWKSPVVEMSFEIVEAYHKEIDHIPPTKIDCDGPCPGCGLFTAVTNYV